MPLAQVVTLVVGLVTLAAVVFKGGRIVEKIDTLTTSFDKHTKACSERHRDVDATMDQVAGRMTDIEVAHAGHCGNGCGGSVRIAPEG